MKKILVAEDNEFYLEELLQCLEMYDVQVATDGEAALQILLSEPGIQMAILDQRMPKLDGTEVLQKIRPSLPDLNIIILTGMSADFMSTKKELSSDGKTVFIQKDTNPDALLCAIRSFVS